jgi:hypothetical protein
MSGSSLRVANLISTPGSCGNVPDTQQRAYLYLLGTASTFENTGTMLTLLTGSSPPGKLVFTPGNATANPVVTDIVGIWGLTGITRNDASLTLGAGDAAHGELHRRCSGRRLRLLPAGIRVDLGVEDQDVDVAPRREHVVQPAGARDGFNDPGGPVEGVNPLAHHLDSSRFRLTRPGRVEAFPGEGGVMADLKILDRAFHLILKRMVDTGQAPHYTEIASEMGIAMNKSGDMVYYLSGDEFGLVAGSRGAAELEALTGYKGDATTTMDSISVSHILLILAIILANIGMWAIRGQKK